MLANLTLSRFGWNRKPSRRRAAAGCRGFLKRRPMRLESLEDRRLLTVEPVSSVFGGLTGGGASFLDTASEYATSRDGRFVVFSSEATDFVAPGQDINGAGTDVFLYDRLDQTVRLISRADGTSQTADGASFAPMISDNGLLVAFLSTATNLVAGQIDANGDADLFLYDVAADTMRLISHTPGSATTAANGGVLAATMNSAGSVIAFDSLATNLVASQNDLNAASDVFLSTITPLAPSGATQLVSRAAGGGVTQTGNGASRGAIIASGGGRVLYESEAANLVPDQVENNAGSDVFLFDALLQTTILVSGSFGSQTETANGVSHVGSMDFFGRFAVITSEADDLATVFDPETQTLTPAPVTDANGGPDIYLFDAATLAMTLVSRTVGDPTQTADAPSSSPTLSPDGRFVAFTSAASDIVPGDVGGFEDVFLYDRIFDSSELISHAYGRPLTPGNGDSTAPTLSNDGRFVAFESTATDLVGITDPITNVVTLMVDNNGAPDVFVYDRGPGVMRLASHLEPLGPLDPPATGDDASTHPVISANGLSIAYNTLASDIFLFDINGVSDVMLFSTAPFGTNSAPVLNPAVVPELTPILEGDVAADIVGTAVDDLLATPGLYSDLDGAFSKGIAITGRNQTNGAWSYSTDGGMSWISFGTRSNASAILLSADGAAQNRVRFVPTDPQFFGTATFTFRGWDMTDGLLSGSVGINVSLNGGNRAYSAQTATGLAIVLPVNDVPTFVKGADQSVQEDAGPRTVLGWATQISAGPANEAGQVLTFVLTPDNPGLFSQGPAINPATGTLTFTTAPDAVGVAVIDVVLVDNGGRDNGGIDTSDVRTFLITITGVNDPPVPGPNVEALEDSSPQSVPGWILPGGGPDEAGQTVTILAFSSTNPQLFTDQPALAADGTLTFTPAPDAFGVATVTVTLQDNGGTANGGVDTAVTNRTITIINVNDAPSFTPSPDVTVLEDSGAFSAPWATGISAGPNEGFQTLTFLVNSDRPELFAVPPAIHGATGVLSFTPAPDAFGTAIVTVQLVDNGGVANGGQDASAAQTFATTIEGAPPAVTIDRAAGQSSPVGQGPTHFTAVFTDPVTGFDHLDVLVSGTAAGPFTVAVTQLDADRMVYDVAVNGMSGRGTVVVDVLADAGVDRAGHLSQASTSTDNVVFYEPPQIVDNSDPGFSLKGGWVERLGGFHGTTQLSRNRKPGTTATWTVPIAPGRYHVYVTWTPAKTNATNATYTIFDGGVRTGKVAVNQRRAPNDLNSDGAMWGDLGVFDVYSDTLTIVLGAKANGRVRADAVRIGVEGESPSTTTKIIDDGDLAFTRQGAWSIATAGFQRDVRRSAKGVGKDTATWSFLVEPGEYQVATTWRAMPRVGATNAPFAIAGNTQSVTLVNQRLAPDDFADGGANWENLGTVTVTGHLLTVTLSDLANGTVAADAIRIQKVTPSGPLAVAQSDWVRSLDATLAALAATGASPQVFSPVLPLKSQNDAVDAIFAGTYGPALL